MVLLALAFAALGLQLLLASSRLARVVCGARAGRRRDPGAIAHLLRIAGMLLLVAALLALPHHPETAAFRPPPDAPAGAAAG